ncbi:MFS transporter [Mycobacterium persicum]|uniref:MFS transporter n=1 Tax=Mycobacterium persicum TaxID=1487726 RepID=A0A1X0L5L8_9MYCO|nr:MFS transporter [Mycobacterium persicum]KZS82716.1 MFS transporter [Mycobacterium persicum]ORB47065.1 MFS transporter [Mycobacterium persicum]ORB88801.1 MFS transporter [Mycobacterium persicum]ORB94175.1 MFS transporter [Mycobacterium persicum]ORC00859.1 MFS transporter [Mycobacterium persicum]
MTGFWAQFRSFSRPSRVLMINQFGASIGFYMLMPYLSSYLAGTLGLAAWAVGLVLGVRNFSQQGMFFVGGTLADRLGYKPLIVAGCLLRIGAFGLLAIAQSLSTLLIAAAATGFAGALFNPALRAYLATEADDRRIEAFATLNMFNRAGIFLGPLIGLAFVTSNFRMSVLAATVIFAVLALAQLLALPGHRSADPGPVAPAKTSIISDWRAVAGNRSFLRFAATMTGSYLLSSQIYLMLPAQASVVAPHSQAQLVAALFGTSGLVAVAGQLRITRWFSARWRPGRSVYIGVALMAASFAPLAAIPNSQRLGTPAAVAALLAAAALLAVASAAVFPFEMHIVVSLSSERLVATHYGFYNTIIGVGILAGNFAIGALLGTEHRLDSDELVWAALILVGLTAATGLYRHDATINAPGRAVPD